jgi:hypothetical protein
MELVIKDTSAQKMFVPILMMTATPIAARNNRGSIQELVVRRRISIMMGSRIINALTTVVSASSRMPTRSTASPAIAFSSPISSHISSQASFSLPLAMLIGNRAFPSLIEAFYCISIPHGKGLGYIHHVIQPYNLVMPSMEASFSLYSTASIKETSFTMTLALGMVSIKFFLHYFQCHGGLCVFRQVIYQIVIYIYKQGKNPANQNQNYKENYNYFSIFNNCIGKPSIIFSYS